MAQPRPRQRPAEPEEIGNLQRLATEGATAFRDYILTGNAARRTAFWEIYNRRYAGATLHDNQEFMSALFGEMDRLRQNPQVRPILDAYTADRDRVWGIQMEPVVMTDFIDAVFNVRTRLSGGSPTDQQITDLARQVRESDGRAVRADTQVGRVRALMQADRSLSVEEAARRELLRPAREDSAQRYGTRLTEELSARLPNEQARTAVLALRDFILTGDTARRDEFRRIFDSNTSDDFMRELTAAFRARIYDDTASGLAPIARAYYTRHNNSIDPIEFARMIATTYTTATSGTAADLQAIRTREGTDVIDPLLNIVARGMAGRAVGLVRTVLDTGDLTARDAFIQIMNGRLGTVVNGQVQMPIVDRNDIFWSEFTRLYGQEVTNNSRLTTIVRSFQRNILPIALRDIVSELGRTTPDLARLNADYGASLVTLIRGNIANLSWMARPEAALNEELERRAGFEDTTAVQLRGMRGNFGTGTRPTIGVALAETYLALHAERLQSGGIEGRDLLEQNFDQLSWLDGAPAAVQREIDRRAAARPPETIAVAMRSRYGTNAGTTLSASYRTLRALRQRRQQLVTSYGREFVDLVSRNMDNLSWVLRPVEDIETELRARRDEDIVRRITSTAGFTVGTLGAAVREIYADGASQPNRAQLEQRYGADLVTFVRDNRSNLSWLSGDSATVERGIQERTDQTARNLSGRFLYGYSPIQFVSAIARARAAISRGGTTLANERDALGTLFVAPVVARQAPTSPPNATEASQATQAVIEARSRTVEGDLSGMESQLRRSILEPARSLLTERIRRWRQQSTRIVLDARSTDDPRRLADLEQEQRRLMDTMLTESDLRKSVEMAFSMIHLAETGGDINRSPIIPGVTSPGADIGGLRTLMDWFRRVNPDKQEAIRDVVSSVLRRADPQLFEFVLNMDEPAYFDAVNRAYRVLRGGTADTRRGLTERYGERFVGLVEQLAPNLQSLELSGANIRALARGDNDLFANIVTRVYRATSNPQGTENRDLMVRLFGEEFVAAVEAQSSALSPLSGSGAGPEQFRQIPQASRDAIMRVYPAAYAKSIGALLRNYRRQDDSMFYSLGSIYDVLSHRPPRGAPQADVQAFDRRVEGLRQQYGPAFVQAVQTNFDQLGFVASPSSTVDTMRGLPVALLETLNRAFEAGPGPGRANFMRNFDRMATVLPQVFLQIRSAIVFSNPTDQISINLDQAIRLYRQEFGSSDYLFRQYFNLDLLQQSIPRLAARYNLTLPPDIVANIGTPEGLARFLATREGRDLVTRGRQFYDTIETEYLRARDERNFHPATGEFSDSEVANLRNRITIFDALYMGVALERVSGTDSAFRRSSAIALMNSILMLTNRDPYLVGPFLLQVLPAFLQVAQEERTFIAALEGFNQIIAQRYEAGMRDLAYSTALNRRYFLEVFARIGEQLPRITSTFDHNRLEDELRLQPEPRSDEGYLSPFLYRYRPNFLQQGFEPLPNLFGQMPQPMSLLPRPFLSPPGLYVPGSPTVLSDADGLYGRLSDQLVPPAQRMFRQRVPARFRIGALGASTILRRLNELFGPMPVDYSDYWLNAFGEAGTFYQHQEQGGASTDRGGLAAAASGRTITGGLAGQARWTRDATSATGGTGGGQTAISQTQDTVDVTTQAARIPYPMAGIIPLSLGAAEGAGLHRAREDFHYETGSSRTDTTPAQVPGQPPPQTVTTGDVTTRSRMRGVLDTYSRIARDSGADMLVFVAGEHVPELTTPGGQPGDLQQSEDRLKTRLYLVTREGNIYQVAYGVDTRASLLNYMYAGANTQQVLASARLMGRDSLVSPALSGREERERAAAGRTPVSGDAARGFDGAAIGFTLPTGGGDSFSSLAFGELVRSMSTMDPVHAEQATGLAVTNLLADRRARDIYAVFYRGAQTVDLDPRDRTHITNSRWSEG
ncbi:MAG: hypothetical protein U0R44_02830, partial [Candidatus Micrarchaeia archaeon]